MKEERKIPEKSRRWLVTINNPLDHGMSHEAIRYILETKFKKCEYWCMCDEIGGKEETPHTHLYIACVNGILFSTMKNRFPSAHLDYPFGTSDQCREYIRKEGKWEGSEKETTNLRDTFEEWGNLPHEEQGKRNDITYLYNAIKDGKDNYEILDENPKYVMQIEKLDKVRQVINEKVFRNSFRDLSVEYWYGATGTGKTRTIMEAYGYSNVYRVTDYEHPFDSYRGQDVIVFEEFNSKLPVQLMLTLLDGYPVDLPCRYANKVACYTQVYIVSNKPLNQQYTNIQKDNKETWLAFLRRINRVSVFLAKDNVISYTLDDYLKGKDFSFVPVGSQMEIPF